MKNKKKLILWIAYGALMVATILVFVFTPQIFGVKKGINPDGSINWDPRSVFDVQVSDNPFLQYMASQFLPNLLHTIQIVGMAVTLGIALHYAMMITFRSKKGITIAKLIANFLKWVIAIVSVFFVMDAWGADTTTMIASAGVVTLIIGLGSQALVADIIAGVFIVFEGDFQVGDIVIIDGWRGMVESIGIRTTRLKDAGGNIKVVNNSKIGSLVNQTKDLSVAKCYVGTSYNDRIENVEKVIAENIGAIKDKIPAIVEGPFYKGVAELGPSSVDLLFVARCKEDDVYQVQRDLNREIKILFDNHHIGIPFPQVTVSYDEGGSASKVSAKVSAAAESFVEEQKEASKGIEDRK
ncbi:MAG: mechanosensitive ion channel family protein [Bacilli bacterium]|nr:mechanosensitive ion channel family protein [Bacilli bacterium]